ncbi:MAG: flagellar biosynthetic protein FliO [Thiotrichales bacterium]|nr:flagellar biosynthetic protein FliO [Thiotrichales bacterium]
MQLSASSWSIFVTRLFHGFLGLFLGGFSSALLAEQTLGQTPQIGESVVQPTDYFAQIFFSLLLILLIIFISAWLLRRYGRFAGVAEGQLKVLGALSVGPRERILLLQVGKEQILVGVTANKISALHQLAEPVSLPTETSVAPFSGAFAQRLQEALQRKNAMPAAADSSQSAGSESKEPNL